MTWNAARRIQDFKPTVFAEMSELSARHGAVNLGQGFPDFPGPAFVKDAAKRAIDADFNQYAHPNGAPAVAPGDRYVTGRNVTPSRSTRTGR